MEYRQVRIAGPLIDRIEALAGSIQQGAERDGIPAGSLSRQVGIVLAIGCAELERVQPQPVSDEHTLRSWLRLCGPML